MIIADILMLAAGIYLIVISFLMNTNDKIRCKVLPFMIGLYCILYALVRSNILILNI